MRPWGLRHSGSDTPARVDVRGCKRGCAPWACERGCCWCGTMQSQAAPAALSADVPHAPAHCAVQRHVDVSGLRFVPVARALLPCGFSLPRAAACRNLPGPDKPLHRATAAHCVTAASRLCCQERWQQHAALRRATTATAQRTASWRRIAPTRDGAWATQPHQQPHNARANPGTST